MVFGYRLGVPLGLDPDGVRLPRRSVQMLEAAPGVVTVPDTGTAPSSTNKLAPGDLLFFDGSTDDGTAVDHVGIYLGRDSAGAPRFISSRKTVDGPTMGDVGGKSLLTGTGLYAGAWRAARRV
jgi:cell wall-associated NlpC family hydrolase